MKNLISLLLIFMTLTSCCSWKAWIGYDKPVSTDYIAISNTPIKVGTQNLNEDQELIIKTTIAEVFEIFKSPEFQIGVKSHSWLGNCKLNENGENILISGEDVYEELMNNFVNFSVNPRNPCAAIAQTQKHTTKHYKNRIAIRPDRINYWRSTNINDRAKLINTIAHEITHTVSYKFQDSGHGTINCPDKDLVSYGLGNLTETIWLSKQ